MLGNLRLPKGMWDKMFGRLGLGRLGEFSGKLRESQSEAVCGDQVTAESFGTLNMKAGLWL